MKQPFRRNTPIDQKRISRWLDPFVTYRDTVTEIRINRWLEQFDKRNHDLAARVLDAVEFITNQQIRSAFRSILNSIHGWHKDKRIRKGKWRFAAYSYSAGESADTMLHVFRQANGLSGKAYNELFIHKSKLLIEKLGPEDTVVFVDDFAGTGLQACGTWVSEIQELLPESPNAYLALVACNVHARKKIEEITGLAMISHTELNETDNIFSPECKHFNKNERGALLKYCMRASRKYPKGFGDSGLLIVFSHNCPNSSIPILHAHHQAWDGLFPRFD